jgi:hypothetical protein
MQDKYAGDIGDFGKFILLRQLQLMAGRQLRVGINWYRVTKLELGSNDGKHTAYLDVGRSDAPLFYACDQALLDNLRSLVTGGRRSIRELEQSCLLSDGALYFSDPVPYGAPSLAVRVSQRNDWFERSMRALEPAKILFLDPDNGIQTAKVKKTHARSIKYAFADEIQEYCRSDRIVIVYNHRDHSPSSQYAKRFSDLAQALGNHSIVRVLHFGSFSARDYVFIYRSHHSTIVDRVFTTLAARPYDFMFKELKLR